MTPALAELTRRISLAENARMLHGVEHRHIEAAACEIRIQAFREAVAIVKGCPLSPNHMMQSDGVRSAEAAQGRKGGGSHG